MQEDIHRDLIKKCLSGDGKAFYQIYKLYSKAMYNLSYRITNDAEEAEDVLQEAFIKAFSKLEQFSGQSTFGAWLKRIVINQAISNKKNMRLLFDPEWDYQNDLQDQYDPWVEDRYLDVQRIHEGINHLPKGYRMVLTLYLLEGYDHQEISEILGITEATSKSQYHRARQKLKEFITKDSAYVTERP